MKKQWFFFDNDVRNMAVTQHTSAAVRPVFPVH